MRTLRPGREAAGFRDLRAIEIRVDHRQEGTRDGELGIPLDERPHALHQLLRRAPFTADADTGYGNAINVIRTVRELMDAGAAGMFLEDQVWPKRCGHMQGKQVIPLEEHVKKLKAAIEAKQNRDFFIVARTDSRQALGLDAAIERGIAFKEAGADAVFIEAPESKEEMREISKHVPGPLVANMLERGVTPLMAPNELKELGFDLIVWPLAPLYSAAKSLTEVYTRLRRDGSTLAILDRLMPFDQFNRVVGLDEKYALDAKYRS